MANRQADPDAIVRLLVQQQNQNGDFIIEIPATWKVTFGAVNPGAPPHGRDLHCMRLWEGEKLRAVYCDVRGFRDLAIPFARKVQAETRSATWAHDSTGNFKSSFERQLEPATFLEEDIPFGGDGEDNVQSGPL